MNTVTNNTPAKLGIYKVIREIASGSMGTVYEGYDPSGERPVAIKVSRANLLQDEEQARRYTELFMREARTAGMLHHPNILEVYDSGVDQGHHYIVFELIKHARTLKDYSSLDKLLPAEEVVELMLQCAKGLEYAHRHGVIHRDIKPANLLVTEQGKIKIADFSIAFINQTNLEMTMPTGFVGSPRYMSPEQVQEDVITPQSDLYSLGIVMYELLTGKHPFEAKSFSRLIYKVVNEEAEDPSTLNAELPKSLCKYVLHALKKDPSARFQSASEMIKYLGRVYHDKKASTHQVDHQSKGIFEQISTLKFFKNFEDQELQTFLGLTIWQDFEAGSLIIRENERDDGLYILVAGHVSIRKGDNQITLLKKGECFGEIACITKAPRCATAIAEDQVTVLKINGLQLEKLTTETRLKLCEVLMHTLAERLAETTEKLNSVSTT